MSKQFSFLVLVYLIAVISTSIASVLNIDVQNLYRIPVINIRWIDIAILSIVATSIYGFTYKKRNLKNTNFIVFLCIAYLVFESMQLIRTWGVTDAATQVSLFICTLSMFIVVNLAMYSIPVYQIVVFLRQISIWGAFTVIILNGYLLYSFFLGKVVVEDLDVRIAIEVVGGKETVYSFVLVPFIYSVGLYSIQKSKLMWEKLLFTVAILSIYGALVITFWRGTLVMILLVTVYFLVSSSNAKQILLKMVGLILFIGLGYFIFGDILAKKGYDPVDKIVEIVKFSTDVENPDWDKGRIAAQEFAIREWEKNLWIGAGYDELGRATLKPANILNPHNGIITSLFHRGIIGTTLLMLIFIVLFKYAISCWWTLKNNKTYESEMIKFLIIVSFFWIITFLTQEALWEKYSLSIQFLYLGLITNIYKQVTK